MGGSNSKAKSRPKSAGDESPRFTPRPSPDVNSSRPPVEIRVTSADKRYSVPSGLQPPASQQERHSIAVPGSSQETSSLADIQLVLFQLCEKKPKYSLLKDMDFESLDPKAQFVVHEAACELLDQHSTIERLQTEQRLMKSNLNVVKRVQSFDNIDHPKHRRVASHELATVLREELENNPPRLNPPKPDPAVAELVQRYRGLQKQFLETALPELRKSLSSKDACEKVQASLREMLTSARKLHERRLQELLDLAAAGPSDSAGAISRLKLQLETPDNRGARQAAQGLLQALSSSTRVQSLIQRPQWLPKGPAELFMGDCASWAWRVACAGLGEVSLASDSKVFNADLHGVFGKSESKRAVSKINFFVWPILYRNGTAISKGLVQLAD